VGDRHSVNSAYNDVMQCGPNLSQDIQTFRKSAASRRRLLTRLADMPSRSALSAPMLGDITGAWQASVKADSDFAAWARDEASNGCIPGQSDPHLQAATGPDLDATNDKKAFLRLWTPLAEKYNLTRYRQGQL
jgi:hypothetical protein